ncbi:hypothetical protein GCM10029978_114290 [Actinoallomurus acanthiterrae]
MTTLSSQKRRSAALASLHRRPVLTAVIFAVTAVVNLAQLAVPRLLTELHRTPAEVHGQWWRALSSLFVQDGGIVGTASNLAFLAVIGAVAEQVLSRPRWLLQYFGVGIAAEFIGYAWDPVGGGNSIAVCGLAGAVAFALWRGDPRLPAFTSQAQMMWCGVLIGTISSGLLIPGVIGGAVAGSLAERGMRNGVPVHRVLAAATLVAAIVLDVFQNIHGGALTLGLALALVTGLPYHRSTPQSVAPAR